GAVPWHDRSQMIGVLHKPGQTKVVEEFFELFKTPWEVCRPGQRYDVVISTVDSLPDIETGLLLSYGATSKSDDAASGIELETSRPSGTIQYRGTSVPIFDCLTTFKPTGGWSGAVADGAGAIAGVRRRSSDQLVLRLGYDLFREAELLLSSGQPVERAEVPT